MKQPLFNLQEVKKAQLILRAINNKLRTSIIYLLEKNKELNVTEIYIQLRVEQSVVSQHLAILRRAGIVKTERKGKIVNYSIDYDRVDVIKKYYKLMIC